MNYFIDTEFHEYAKQPKKLGFSIGKAIPTIDLISIGIVSEDGREYYAICKDFDVDAAWDNDWLQENVLQSIWNEWYQSLSAGFKYFYGSSYRFTKKGFKKLLQEFGKSREQISNEIRCFIDNKSQVNFYAYYADYDWVVFCWLFGRMMDLPKGFPMYCKDLKQIMDSKGLDSDWKDTNCPDPEGEHNALVDAKWNLQLYNAINK
jgi:hypothetical protein